METSDSIRFHQLGWCVVDEHCVKIAALRIHSSKIWTCNTEIWHINKDVYVFILVLIKYATEIKTQASLFTCPILVLHFDIIDKWIRFIELDSNDCFKMWSQKIVAIYLYIWFPLYKFTACLFTVSNYYGIGRFHNYSTQPYSLLQPWYLAPNVIARTLHDMRRTN